MQPPPLGSPTAPTHRRHLPPAVSVDVTQSGFSLGVAAVWGQVALLLAVWALLLWQGRLTHSLGLWLMAACTVLAVTGALVRLVSSWQSVRRLQWDGSDWHLSIAGCERLLTGQATLVLDWQHALCLRFDVQCGQAARYWVWVSKPAVGDAWMALRRAAVATRQMGLLIPPATPSAAV